MGRRRCPRRDRAEAGLVPQRLQIHVGGDARRRECRERAGDPLERLERVRRITAQRMETGDVVPRKRIVGALGQPFFEAFDSQLEVALDGKLIYSKKQMGRFPELSELLEKIPAQLRGVAGR